MRTYTAEEFNRLPGFIRAELVGGAIYTDDWTTLEVDDAVFWMSRRKSATFHIGSLW